MRATCLISLATLMLVVSAPAFASWTEQVPEPEPAVETPDAMPAPLEVQTSEVALGLSNQETLKPAEMKLTFSGFKPAATSLGIYAGEPETDEPEPFMKVYKLQQTFKPYPAFLRRNGPASAASVPEPGSLVALGAGLIGLMIRRRK